MNRPRYPKSKFFNPYAVEPLQNEPVLKHEIFCRLRNQPPKENTADFPPKTNSHRFFGGRRYEEFEKQEEPNSHEPERTPVCHQNPKPKDHVPRRVPRPFSWVKDASSTYRRYDEREHNNFSAVPPFSQTNEPPPQMSQFMPLPPPNYKQNTSLKKEVRLLHIPVSYHKAITITQNCVFLYDTRNQNMESFPSAIDYGADPPLVGVEYCSPTVIKNFVNNFGTNFHDENLTPIRKIYDDNEIRQYYLLKDGQNELLVSTKRVMIDLIKEAIHRLQPSEDDNIFFTIPSNFSDDQKTLFLKATEIVGAKIFKTVDEQLALANGFYREHVMPQYIEYVLLHFNYLKAMITLQQYNSINNKSEREEMIDYKKLLGQKIDMFDEIIQIASKEKDNNVDAEFPNDFRELIESVTSFFTNSRTAQSLVVTRDHLFYAILSDYFDTNIKVYFIENPDELIVRGSIYANV